MPLGPGTRLGPYEILSAIGTGGMGEVYRARDTRLKRDVALKILPDSFATDPDRLARFQREAEVLASLNHPHIAAIYGLEESHGTRALVMELVEGETLADRIARGPIPLDEALPIAKQIAEALEAAHEQGIIHRDLKPANIKVRPDGTVKVLDFGLAKLTERSAASSIDASMSPTITSPAMMTGIGVLLGTAAYMAPEQAKGRPADKRSDIWAFGCVLYEMITGQRAFDGDDVSSVLAAVIRGEPAWDIVPRRVRRLVEKCLEKDPRRRLRDIGDAWELLDDAAPSETRTSPSRVSVGASIVAALSLLALASVLIVHLRQATPTSSEALRFEIAAPDKTVIQKFAVSPDGRKIAFYAVGDDGVGALWVRSFDSLESKRIAETAPSPSITWSPDSRFIAFPTGEALNKLVKVEPSGGPPQAICDIRGIITGGSWNAAGVIVFGTYGGGVWRVAANGGVPSPVTALDASRQEHGHSTPVLLPDGKHFLYLRESSVSDNTGIYLGALDAAPAQQSLTRIVATTFSPVYAPSTDPNIGYVLFLRDNALHAQAFDLTTLQMTADPVRLADHVGSIFEFGYVGVSSTGVLAYRNGNAAGGDALQLTWFDRQGRNLGAGVSPGYYTSQRLSPDASQVAVTRLDVATGNADIWLHEFARNTVTRLTSDQAPDADPVWSPDGARVAYASSRVGGTGLYEKAANGAGGEEVLLAPQGIRSLDDWSDDGRFLIYSELNAKGKSQLWVMPLAGDRKPSPYFVSDFNEMQGQFSPDGRWTAYVSDESGHAEIYVRPFPITANGGGKWTVSNGGGAAPRWKRDGKELFYLAANFRTVMTATVSGTKTFSAGVAAPLLRPSTLVVNIASVGTGGPGQSGNSTWDVTGDGKKFLLITTAAQPAVAQAPITLVLNWTALLKK